MEKKLELYIHIPFCMKKCAYCDFLSFSSDEKTQKDYVESLIREIRYYGAICKDLVSSIFIGGGTPTWLDADLLIQILDEVYHSFQVQADAEISIECNPGTVTAENMKKYFDAGVNRLSIGLQSADDEELKLLGRVHNFDKFLRTYEMARSTGFRNINIDLISGLPYQNAEKFLETLHKVIRLKPEHLSVYTLMIEKGTPFYDRYKFDAVKQEAGMPTEILPDEDEAYRIYKLTQSELKKNGFIQYEVSNYAKKGYECKHNLGYWDRINYLGLGLGASSCMDNVRYRNISDLYDYMNATNQMEVKEWTNDDGSVVVGLSTHESAFSLTRKAQMEEFMFLGLRKLEGVSRSDFENCFGISIDAIYKEVMDELRAQGLLEVRNGAVLLTDKGMDLSNYVLSKFLL